MSRAIVPVLERMRLAFEHRNNFRCLLVDRSHAEIGTLLKELNKLLQPKETAAIRALWIDGQAEPEPTDFFQACSLEQLLSVYLSRHLKQVLLDASLICHFQPIVHAKDTSMVFGYEALMRGLQRDLRMVAPVELLEYAKSADMLFLLDQHARRQALTSWHEHRIDAPLFINFSHTALANSRYFLKHALQLIDQYGLARRNIVFEIVESSGIEDMASFKRAIQAYRDEGIRLALDDVGSGYSSLNMLHKLQPDFVKLDMALIRDVHLDPYKATITRKLIELARELGVQTIAEGVETLDELGWLQAHGADLIQGYLIGRPASSPTRQTPRLVPETKSAVIPQQVDPR